MVVSSRREPDLTEAEHREHAEKLEDLMAKGDLLPRAAGLSISTHVPSNKSTKRRHDEAAQATRRRPIAGCCLRNFVRRHLGWEQLDEDQQQRVAEPLVSRATTE